MSDVTCHEVFVPGFQPRPVGNVSDGRHDLCCKRILKRTGTDRYQMMRSPSVYPGDKMSAVHTAYGLDLAPVAEGSWRCDDILDMAESGKIMLHLEKLLIQFIIISQIEHVATAAAAEMRASPPVVLHVSNHDTAIG